VTESFNKATIAFDFERKDDAKASRNASRNIQWITLLH
jgi:hypothetical protein